MFSVFEEQYPEVLQHSGGLLCCIWSQGLTHSSLCVSSTPWSSLKEFEGKMMSPSAYKYFSGQLISRVQEGAL